jgi:hypothetical protein
MLVGGWLGKVEASEWSQARLEEAESVQKRADPSGQQTRHYARGLAERAARDRRAWPVAIAVGSVAAVVNYFTLYGPAMFISSLVVGVFLGWIWALKLPEWWADIDAAPGS